MKNKERVERRKWAQEGNGDFANRSGRPCADGGFTRETGGRGAPKPMFRPEDAGHRGLIALVGVPLLPDPDPMPVEVDDGQPPPADFPKPADQMLLLPLEDEDPMVGSHPPVAIPAIPPPPRFLGIATMSSFSSTSAELPSTRSGLGLCLRRIGGRITRSSLSPRIEVVAPRTDAPVGLEMIPNAEG